MAIPEFIQDLRADIGHKLLPVIGAAAVVVGEDGRVLLQQRADNGRWAVPGGLLDPGEQPADGAAREIHEETGVTVEIDYLSSVRTSKPAVLENGDVIQATTLVFRAHPAPGSGEARVNDDESLAVAWFAPGDLPADVPPRHRAAVERALSGNRETWFQRA